ncbi:Prenylcysteine oxidase [Rhynchospora pubera]|uniref:Prenylcysteine oxidase n=1 Tax=Rhynchospora pubera TaxID=906938 RepID=A0AAV8F6W3_9POAL|nr:Prenylcysteine oxidase [Rhynchospora pubera]
MAPSHSHLFLPLLLLLLFSLSSPSTSLPTSVCVIGSGIGGSSLSFFLQNQTAIPTSHLSIRVFERRGRIGGRTASVNLSGDLFNAGASIIHGKNLHAVRFAELLGLDRVEPDGADWLGIWDGSGFVFKTLKPPPDDSSAIWKWLYGVADALLLVKRYGLSLSTMQRFVKDLLDKFMLFYMEPEKRPVFKTVEEMLKWNGLYGLTQITLEEVLIGADLSSRLISELVTVITRINYGQSVAMSGLAGAVALAGSNADLWTVKGGNWLLAKGLLELTKPTLHLHEGIESISDKGDHYLLTSDKGKEYECDVTVVATPLDEVNITFVPPVSIPYRRMQHTYTTFIRGLLNPKYFGLSSIEDIPDLVGTIETPNVSFSSVSILKQYGERDFAYKIFSRSELDDTLLDQLFSVRRDTIRIDWSAYPHYKAPEKFAPFLLDERHLYYINTFESAASCIETSAVAAENVARLIISRLLQSSTEQNIKPLPTSQEILHSDL